MAIPSGGGGGGSLVGFSNSFTGTAQALELVGDHCYAYSGLLTIDNNETTMLEFTTGNKLIVATITCVGMVNPASAGSGGISGFSLLFNGGEVARMKVDTQQEDTPPDVIYPIIIPPYTEVKLTVQSKDTDANNGRTCAIIAGQTFQTRD